MKLHTKILGALATGLLGFALVGFGGENVVSFGQTYFGSPNNFTDTIEIPKFPTRQGELVGMRFSLQNEVEWNELVRNVSAEIGVPSQTQTWLGWSYSQAGGLPSGPPGPGYTWFAFALELPNSGQFTQATFRDWEQVILSPGQELVTGFDIESPQVFSQTITDPKVLESFTGTGTVEVPIEASTVYWTTGGNNTYSELSSLFWTDITVEYIYE